MEVVIVSVAQVLVPEGMDPEVAQRHLNAVASNDNALRRVEEALSAAETPVAPAAARMLAEVEMKWREFEAAHEMLDAARVGELLGLTTRSSVSRLRESRGLVATKRRGRLLYPDFQFHQRVALNLAEVTGPLRAAEWSDDDIIMWMISPNGHTPDQVAPMELLEGGSVPTELVALAEAAASPAW